VPVPAGNYLLTLKQLIVSDDARIAGGGQARTIIDGNASSAVFLIGAFSLRSGSWILLGRKLGYLRWLDSSEKLMEAWFLAGPRSRISGLAAARDALR